MAIDGVSQGPVEIPDQEPVQSAQADQAPAPEQVSSSSPSSSSSSGGDQVSDHTLLQSGSRGTEVNDLQDRLNKAGYQTGDAGVFDQRTAQAVRQYQRDNGLKVDGKVGQQTWGNFLGQKLPPGTQMLRQPTNPDPTGRFKDTFEPAGSGRPGAQRPQGTLPPQGSQRPQGTQAPQGPQGTQAPQRPQGTQAPQRPQGTQGPAAPTQAPANGSTVDRMLAEARKHVGYHEGAGNRNMFSTAMGRPAEAWCADFVSYVARQAGANTVNTASAQGVADQLAKQGRWKGHSNPQPGDAVTFNWSGSGGRANHVGLVESVFRQNNQLYIRTIEGNSSDAVRYRTYPVNSRVINGFGRIA